MTIERIPIGDGKGGVNRELWLGLRRQDCTASDVPAICGEGLYGSATKVWAEKRGLLPAQEQNEAMKRGLWGEAAVFEALSSETDWELRRAKIYLRDPVARLGATPDGAAIDPNRPGVGIVQAKVIARPVFERDWLHDPDDDIQFGEATPPLAYQLQTLTEANLAEADWAVLAVLVVDTFKWVLRIFPIERHAGAEAMIRDRVSGFWTNYLDPGIQPPTDPARDSELMGLLYPQDDGTTIDLSGDNELPELIAAREGAKAAIKAAEVVCKNADTSIKSKLGANTFGRLGDGRLVSWKRQERSGFTVEPTAFRVLRILKAKRS